MAAAPQQCGLADSARPSKQAAAASSEQSHVAATADHPARDIHEQSKRAVDGAATLPTTASMPPPAPPPPHPKPTSVPPPLPPRSLHQPWQPCCTLLWYMTESPTVRSGLSLCKVSAKHYSTLLFLGTLSLTMRYPFSVLECAMALYHRFYVRHSMVEYDVRKVAAVCLFLASKVEDAPRRLIELVRQFAAMDQMMNEDGVVVIEPEKEGDSEVQKEDDEHSARQSVEDSSTVDYNQSSSLPSPAALSPAVSHMLAEQQKRDKLDRLTASEYELRTQFILLESELLLAIDFDFTFPLPSRYIHLLVRQLVLSPPRTDTGKGREGWEEEIGQIAWKRAMVKGGEVIAAGAMRTLQTLLATSACLHCSPQCIAILCVLITCATGGIDFERIVQLGGWVTVDPTAADEAEQPFVDVPAEVKEDAADVRLSPSSYTSTTPSFSPSYAVSPSSPTTASPASLSSIQSSPSQPPTLQQTLSAVPNVPSTVLPPSSPVASPYIAAWLYRVLPGVSVGELLSPFALLCAHPPLPDDSEKAMNDMRRAVLGLNKPKGTAAGDMLDVLHVRAEYEALVSEMTEAKRLGELVAAQKQAEEERKRREEEVSRETVEEEKAQRRVRDVDVEPTRPVSQERQAWTPLSHSPPRTARYGGRGGRGWHADKAINHRPSFVAGREGSNWRGAGHRGGWAGRAQPQSQALGWQSTVIEPSPAAPVAPSQSHSHSHRRPVSPVHRRSPSPPPKRSRRSLSRSPTRRASNGGRDRERDRDRDREREGRALRESGERQRRYRSRSPTPDTASERYRGSSRSSKRRAPSPSPVRDRGRGRR